MSVPAYGLDPVGAMDIAMGDFTAQLRVIDSHTVNLVWRKADGREQKSLPATVKAQFSEDLKELKLAKADIEKMLSAQAQRLDSLFLRRTSWPFETWLERYLHHHWWGRSPIVLSGISKQQELSPRASGSTANWLTVWASPCSLTAQPPSGSGILSTNLPCWFLTGADGSKSGASASPSNRRTARCIFPLSFSLRSCATVISLSG